MLLNYKDWSKLYEQSEDWIDQSVTIIASEGSEAAAAYQEFINKIAKDLLGKIDSAMTELLSETPDELIITNIERSPFDKLAKSMVPIMDSVGIFLSGDASWNNDSYFSDTIIDQDLGDKFPFRIMLDTFDRILPKVDDLLNVIPSKNKYNAESINGRSSEIIVNYSAPENADVYEVLSEIFKEAYRNSDNINDPHTLLYTKFGTQIPFNYDKFKDTYTYEEALNYPNGTQQAITHLLSGTFAMHFDKKIIKIIDDLVYNTDYFEKYLRESHLTLVQPSLWDVN